MEAKISVKTIGYHTVFCYDLIYVPNENILLFIYIFWGVSNSQSTETYLMSQTGYVIQSQLQVHLQLEISHMWSHFQIKNSVATPFVTENSVTTPLATQERHESRFKSNGLGLD